MWLSSTCLPAQPTLDYLLGRWLHRPPRDAAVRPLSPRAEPGIAAAEQQLFSCYPFLCLQPTRSCTRRWSPSWLLEQFLVHNGQISLWSAPLLSGPFIWLSVGPAFSTAQTHPARLPNAFPVHPDALTRCLCTVSSPFSERASKASSGSAHPRTI